MSSGAQGPHHGRGAARRVCTAVALSVVTATREGPVSELRSRARAYTRKGEVKRSPHVPRLLAVTSRAATREGDGAMLSPKTRNNDSSPRRAPRAWRRPRQVRRQARRTRPPPRPARNAKRHDGDSFRISAARYPGTEIFITRLGRRVPLRPHGRDGRRARVRRRERACEGRGERRRRRAVVGADGEPHGAARDDARRGRRRRRCVESTEIVAEDGGERLRLILAPGDALRIQIGRRRGDLRRRLERGQLAVVDGRRWDGTVLWHFGWRGVSTFPFFLSSWIATTIVLTFGIEACG